MPRLSPEKRAQLYTLLSQRETTRAAAHTVGVHQSTAVRLRHHVEAHGHYRDLQRSGRPRILTDRNERQMVRMVMAGECTTAFDLPQKMKEAYGVQVAARSVRRALYRNGLAARIKRKKPLLTKKHRQARLRWALMQKDWTSEDWKRIVWSDESKFNVFWSDGREYC